MVIIASSIARGRVHTTATGTMPGGYLAKFNLGRLATTFVQFQLDKASFEYFYLPSTGWDASPSQGHLWHLILWYPFVQVHGERH